MADTIQQAEKVAAQIAKDLGDNLKAIVLFGTAIRGGYAPARQEVNIMMMVDDASTEAIGPIEKSIAGWVKKGHAAPLIFERSEWEGSTDVFPIEIEEMREAHRLIAGTDPFEGIVTNRDDLRQELEREVRGKLLQLRAQYAAFAPNGRALTRLITDSAPTFFVLMRALVRLEGQAPETKPARLVEQAASIAGLDVDAFAWVVDKISGDKVKSLRSDDPIAARYVDEIQKLTHYVDRA
jgi:hypothetical protein